MDQTVTTPIIDVVDGAVVAADPADQQVTTSTTVTFDSEVYSLLDDINQSNWTIVAILIAFCFAYFALRWF